MEELVEPCCACTLKLYLPVHELVWLLQSLHPQSQSTGGGTHLADLTNTANLTLVLAVILRTVEWAGYALNTAIYWGV